MTKNKEKELKPKPILEVSYTKDFRKEWSKISDGGIRDLSELKKVMLLLIVNDGPLTAEWKDHQLKGVMSKYRECHVGGDYLLVYTIEKTKDWGAIVFCRTGTHAQIFN